MPTKPTSEGIWTRIVQFRCPHCNCVIDRESFLKQLIDESGNVVCCICGISADVITGE